MRYHSQTRLITNSSTSIITVVTENTETSIRSLLETVMRSVGVMGSVDEYFSFEWIADEWWLDDLLDDFWAGWTEDPAYAAVQYLNRTEHLQGITVEFGDDGFPKRYFETWDDADEAERCFQAIKQIAVELGFEMMPTDEDEDVSSRLWLEVTPLVNDPSLTGRPASVDIGGLISSCFSYRQISC